MRGGITGGAGGEGCVFLSTEPREGNREVCVCVFKYRAARRKPMTMTKRPTYRTIVAGVPNHIGEMKLKCRQPARCKRCCVCGWRASGSNCRNVDYHAGGEGVAEIARYPEVQNLLDR